MSLENKNKTRTISVDAPPVFFETRLMKETVDTKERTAEMVFATEKPVRTYRWVGWDIEEFNEVLSMDPKHMRSSRLDKGSVPLLNSHSRWDLKSQIGTVASARFENQKLVGKVRFSKRQDVQEIFDDVADGIISNGSVGYRVYKYEDVSESDDKIRTLKAIDWELIEMSLVPVPADEGSGVMNGSRSDSKPELHKCEIVLRENETQCGNRADLNSKGENMEKETQVPAKPETKIDAEQLRKEAAEQAKQRVSEIREAVRSAKLGQEFEDQMVDSEHSADQVRKMVLEQLAKNDKAAPQTRAGAGVEVVRDENETRREGMVEAIQFRAGVKKDLSEKSRDYGHMKLMDMARVFAGKGAERMGTNEVIARAFHSTSDFPNVLLDAINKTLQTAYAEKPQTFAPFVRKTSLSDFKLKHTVKFGDFPELKKKGEGGEIVAGTIGEGKEAYKLDTYARSVLVTRETIINDDMDAFSRLPEMAARRAREKEADLVYGLITSNPTMGDGKKLFHTGHNNISAAAAMSIDEIGKLYTKIQNQKGLDGSFITLAPRFILAPTVLKQIGSQLISNSFIPQSRADINPWNLEAVITDPRLDASSTTKWYVICGVSDIDMIELASLDGQGPQTNMEEKFGTGVKFEIIHDIGAGLIDYRGFAGNGSF